MSTANQTGSSARASLLTVLTALALVVTTGSWIFGPAGPIPALVVGLMATYLVTTLLVLRRAGVSRSAPSG